MDMRPQLLCWGMESNWEIIFCMLIRLWKCSENFPGLYKSMLYLIAATLAYLQKDFEVTISRTNGCRRHQDVSLETRLGQQPNHPAIDSVMDFSLRAWSVR